MSTTETKVTHTPGPWFVSGSPSSSHAQIFSKDEKGGGCVAQVYRLGMSTHERFQELAANAHLIAAAPDMLEALEELAEAADYGQLRGIPDREASDLRVKRAIAVARAVCAKAKGGTA